MVEAMDHRHLNKEVPEFAHADSHDGEPGHRHLESPAEQAESGEAAPRTCVRDARPVCRFLRRSMKAHLTRRYIFSASHRLHSDQLVRDSRTALIYGKCNNPHGHGHNYAVEVTVSGQVSPRPEWFATWSIWTTAVRSEVIERFDHQNLNTLAGVRRPRADNRKSERGDLPHFEAKLHGRSSGKGKDRRDQR